MRRAAIALAIAAVALGGPIGLYALAGGSLSAGGRTSLRYAPIHEWTIGTSIGCGKDTTVYGTHIGPLVIMREFGPGR